MIEITKEQNVILELIKASLFQVQPVLPDDTNWEEVYELAKTQCIVALLEPVVPAEYRAKWTEDYWQIMSHYAQVTYEQGELIKLFETNNIPMVVLKGTAAAMYYPEPQRRTMGDVDIQVPFDRYDDAKKLLSDNGYQFVSEDVRHSEYEKNNIEFEVHKQFSCEDYNNIEHILTKGMHDIRVYESYNSSFPGFPPYENGLILLGHVMMHLMNSGLGLRQIIDWMMFVHKELDDEAWENHFRPLAAEAGLEKLAVALSYICKKWMGLPDAITWCDGADMKLVELIFERILTDGNFGRSRRSSVDVQRNLKKEGTFKYLQRAGMINWPLAQKYAFFRPFAWLYQIFRYIGKGIVALFKGKNELKGIKDSRDIEEIRRRLG